MSTNYPYKISVIIVNYNVEYFLEQCLRSVYKALQYVQGEVFVVDNNSKDGSVEMVREKFPECTLIINHTNVGFSKANNQAIAQAKGEYVLLLNPDTLIEEYSLKKVVDFMDEHPQAGGLGVKMVDGRGRFLPESKRGLPTPTIAFYKIFGLSKLFPQSKRFGRYHLGYLHESQTNEIEILSGAFMLIRQQTLEKSGTLDETFFMYGEDIDLSYRITRAGYKNYYFPHTRIIHYKGESTKKSSVNYIFVFYRAMIIFANKHFTPKNVRLFSFLIHLAIYLRAFLALASRITKRVLPPIIDASMIALGMIALSHRWANEWMIASDSIRIALFGLYASLWMLTLIYSDFYLLPIKIYSLLKGVLWGAIVILLVDVCLPYKLPLRFLGVASCFVFIYLLISRVFMHFFRGEKSHIFPHKTKRFAIVGRQVEANRVQRILKRVQPDMKKVLFVNPENVDTEWSDGHVNELAAIVRQHKIEELVFCAKDMTNKAIIDWMIRLSNVSIRFKIAPAEATYLIGSNSIDTAGDLYHTSHYIIVQPHHLRNKRTVDLAITTLGFLSLPITLWCFENKIQYVKNLFWVLVGKRSWVGYAPTNNTQESQRLPKLKAGVLSPIITRPNRKQLRSVEQINELYAKKYSITTDITTVIKSWKNIDTTQTNSKQP